MGPKLRLSPNSPRVTPTPPRPRNSPGVNGTVTYSEGLLIDYRWYDANAVAPRFPFGQ